MIAKQSFIDKLLNCKAIIVLRTVTVQMLRQNCTYARVPTSKVERHRWLRLRLRYKIVTYDSLKFLYLKGRGDNSTDKRVLEIEAPCEVLRRTYIENNHVRNGTTQTPV